MKYHYRATLIIGGSSYVTVYGYTYDDVLKKIRTHFDETVPQFTIKVESI